MTDEEWYAARNIRHVQYGAEPLAQSRVICLKADTAYCSSYAGQVAILTAANLLGRLTPTIVLDLPEVEIVPPLPWAGENLSDFLLRQLAACDPRGHFQRGTCKEDCCEVFFGRKGSAITTHGVGWTAYTGPQPSPLPDEDSFNPIGPALSAVLVATRLFVHKFCPPPTPHLFNAFNYRTELPNAPFLKGDFDCPNIWLVGTGSVGTAVLFFLTLYTRKFSINLFDMDVVTRENITRSPIFCEEDVGRSKVSVARRYLESCGVSKVTETCAAFDESPLWKERATGTPDILIPTANERNVRAAIENLFPPIQIYGTTGNNWQASMLRHIPMRDNCSLCHNPKGLHLQTQCATGSLQIEGKTVDASLPFLSFAAGLMAISELLKSTLPGYPFTPNRAYFYARPEPRFCVASGSLEKGCVCTMRSASLYQQAIANSRYAVLSR